MEHNEITKKQSSRIARKIKKNIYMNTIALNDLDSIPLVHSKYYYIKKNKILPLQQPNRIKPLQACKVSR